MSAQGYTHAARPLGHTAVLTIGGYCAQPPPFQSHGTQASRPSSGGAVHAQGVKSWGGRFIGREFRLVTQAMAGPSAAVHGCSNTSGGFNDVRLGQPQCACNRTFVLCNRAFNCHVKCCLNHGPRITLADPAVSMCWAIRGTPDHGPRASNPVGLVLGLLNRWGGVLLRDLVSIHASISS